MLASATIANPQPFAERLVGLPFAAVDDNGAPQPEQTIVLWNPPFLDVALGVRKSALAESSYVLAETVLAGKRTIGFAPTRKAAELVYRYTRRRIEDRDPPAAEAVMPYRAGYTPAQRRDIERRLFDGELRAIVATSALELGIDVGSLDVALVTGFPGTMTSLWQRWGRAGRTGKGWAVLVAGQDALDQYFMREPERLLSRAVEDAIVDLANPQILEAHLCAAAYEQPLDERDETYFGGGRHGPRGRSSAPPASCTAAPAGALVWSQPRSPAGRGSACARRRPRRSSWPTAVTAPCWARSKRERVFRSAHPGAVYLHLGESYLVRHLDLDAASVMVEPFSGAYYTQPKVEKHVADRRRLARRGRSPAAPRCRSAPSRSPSRSSPTRSATSRAPRSSTPSRSTCPSRSSRPRRCGSPCRRSCSLAHVDEGAQLGALHAAEHTCIAVLPLYAMCDRWDIGGLSTAWHWQTDLATVFIYDGHPGGIGLTRRALRRLRRACRRRRAADRGVPLREPAAPRACRAPSAVT